MYYFIYIYKHTHIYNAFCNILLHRQFQIVKIQFSSVQSLSCVRLFVTPWIAACRACLSITNSRSLLKLTSIESVMPCSHLILCRPLLLLPLVSPSIRVFSNESTLCMRWPKLRHSNTLLELGYFSGWYLETLGKVILCTTMAYNTLPLFKTGWEIKKKNERKSLGPQPSF